MAKATILFADNNPDFLEARSDYLRQEGYRVIPANDPTEARRLLEGGRIDLAILDIRLINDDDDKDTSGLTLAKEVARSMPKIILTGFPSVDAVREALRPQLDGLPAAVEFLSKTEDPETLVTAIYRALGPDAVWLRQVKRAIAVTDEELEQDYNNAQRQSLVNFWTSLVVAVLGVAIVFVGVALVLSSQLAVGIASTVGGIVAEVVSILFFRRVDRANDRMDQYHKLRLEGQRFETLLQACEGFDEEKSRERCRERVILTTTIGWLGGEKGIGDTVESQNVLESESTEDLQ